MNGMQAMLSASDLVKKAFDGKRRGHEGIPGLP